MGYEFYCGKTLLPVAPSKLQMKIGGANKTYTLINDGEINVLKAPKLTEISFDLLLPNVNYPFAVYKKNKFKPATYYLEKFESYKTKKKAFQFIVNRELPNGKTLFGTNMKVSLEDYTIKEDAGEEFDIVVSVKLKQYKDSGTKTCKVKFKDTKPKVTVASTRPPGPTAPDTSTVRTYTVVSGDSLWKIAKQFYEDGSKYTVIFNANTDKIKNANLIYPGQVLVIPAA